MVIASKRFNTAKDCYDKKSLSARDLSVTVGEVITDMYIECEDVYGFHANAQCTLKQFLLQEVKPIYHHLLECAIITGVHERCEQLGYYGSTRPKEIIQVVADTIL